MKILSKFLLVLSAAAVLAACSSNRTFESDMQVSGAPDWVNGQDLVKSSEKGKVMRAVGQASPIGNTSLQKTTAANRARAALARELSVAVNTAQRNFASANEGEGESTSEITQENKFNSNVLIAGARIAAYWKDKKKGDIYALAELDVSKIKEGIERSKGLSKEFKNHLKQNPDAFLNHSTGK